MTKEQYHDYAHKRLGCFASVKKRFHKEFGKESVFGAVWELYFEFLIFNEQDRIRSCLPTIHKGGRARDDHGGNRGACHGYFGSLLWRLILVCVCTIGLVMYAVGNLFMNLVCVCAIMVLMYAVGKPVWAICLLLAFYVLWAIFSGGRDTVYSICQQCTKQCSSSKALQQDDHTVPPQLQQEEQQVTGDQYYDVRFRAVYDEVKLKKRRHAHQHAVLLVLQGILNAAALIVSEPATAAMSLHHSLSSNASAYIDGPQMVIQKKLVGRPAPVPLCVPSAEVDTSRTASRWLETELDDECTQVMRYAGCADTRCVEEVHPECSLCAELPPYPSWQQLAASTSTSADMTMLCTGEGRMGRCTYELVQAQPETVDCSEDEESTLEAGDLYVAPLTAALSFIMAMNAYFQVDRMLQSRNDSRMRLQQLGKLWLSNRSIDPEWLARKKRLVDVTEDAFMFTARELHGGDEQNDLVNSDSGGDGDGEEEQQEEDVREEASDMEEGVATGHSLHHTAD